MLIYAFLTEQFVVTLFIAGVMPGLLTIAIYFVAIQIVVRRNPSLAPAGPRQTWTQTARTAANSWGIVSIILIMTVGLYGGVFTVIEAAAAGTLIAFGFAVARGKLNRDSFLSNDRRNGRQCRPPVHDHHRSPHILQPDYDHQNAGGAG